MWVAGLGLFFAFWRSADALVCGVAMKNFDIYASADEFVSLLMTAGHMNEARTLKDAIEEGSTGTEILMSLGFQIRELIERIPLDGEAAALSSQLLYEIKKALEGL